MEISGTIGITVFKEKNKSKYYIIFYDDHSNQKYCKNTFFVDNILFFLNEQSKPFCCFVEEPLISYDKVLSLWTETYHVKRFTDFCETWKNKIEIIYTDIRYNVLPFEFQMDMPEKFRQMKIKDFFIIFFKFLDINFKWLKKIPNDFLIYLTKNKNHQLIENLKKKIIKIFNQINYNDELKEILNKEWIENIQKLLDEMMEIFTYFYIKFSNKKINILYYGFYHSYTISKLLLSECILYYHNGFDIHNVNFDKLLESPSCVKITI